MRERVYDVEFLMKNTSGAILIALALVLAWSPQADAATITINFTDSGWYDATGFHDPSNTNYAAGQFLSDEIRNWFVFNLAGITDTILSATLRLQTANYQSHDATEAYGPLSSVNSVTYNTVIATVAVAPEALGIAVTPDGTRVYVTNLESGNVSVIDTATNTIIASVPVGEVPRGVAVTPDGMHVYVLNRESQSVSIIDTATNTVSATLSMKGEPVSFGPFIGPVTAIAKVIALFDRGVADGMLGGVGPGDSAQGRLQELRDMFVSADRLLAQGKVAAACGQLADVAAHTDGHFQPPDFVQGPAVPELFDAITAVRNQVGCVP